MMQPPLWFVLVLALTFVIERRAVARGPERKMVRVGLGLLLAAVVLTLVTRIDPAGPWDLMARAALLAGFVTLTIRSIKRLASPPDDPDDDSQDTTSIRA